MAGAMRRGRYALATAVLFACSSDVSSEPPAGSSGAGAGAGASAGAGAGAVSVCDGETCDASLTDCPAAPPTEGAACEPAWGYCAYYASGEGCPSSVWRCGGQWTREQYPVNQACPIEGTVCRLGV